MNRFWKNVVLGALAIGAVVLLVILFKDHWIIGLAILAVLVLIGGGIISYFRAHALRNRRELRPHDVPAEARHTDDHHHGEERPWRWWYTLLWLIGLGVVYYLAHLAWYETLKAIDVPIPVTKGETLKTEHFRPGDWKRIYVESDAIWACSADITPGPSTGLVSLSATFHPDIVWTKEAGINASWLTVTNISDHEFPIAIVIHCVRPSPPANTGGWTAQQE